VLSIIHNSTIKSGLQIRSPDLLFEFYFLRAFAIAATPSATVEVIVIIEVRQQPPPIPHGLP